MASGAYVGIDSIARVIKSGYIGVNNVARKIKKVYIGVDGIAMTCWDNDVSYYSKAVDTKTQEPS